MKKLLSILALAIATTPAVMPLVNMQKQSRSISYSNLNSEQIVQDEYEKILIVLEKENITYDDGIGYIEKGPNFVYRIITEELLNNYLNSLDLLDRKIRLLNLDKNQIDHLDGQKSLLEDSNINWRKDRSVDELIVDYSNLSDNEKEISSKVYYSYNQASSQMMLDDMSKYQDIRIENIQALAEVSSLKRQISMKEELITRFNEAQEWQNKLSGIFDNWINYAQSLKDDFDEQWNASFGSVENFFNNLRSKKEEILKPYIDDFFEDAEDKIKAEAEIIFNVENREFNGKKKLQNWLQNLFDKSGENSDEQISNKEIMLAGKEQLNKEISEDDLFEEKINKISDVMSEVYRIDDILFGSIHNTAKSFASFVNNQLPRLSEDISSAFNDNGITIETPIEEEIKIALEAAEAITNSILKVFGDDGTIQTITNLAFATIDEVGKWINTIDVFKNSGEAIELIKDTKQKLTKMPEDIAVDVDEIMEEINSLNKDLIDKQNIIIDTNEELKNSRYEEFKNKLTKFNNEMEQFNDFIDIDYNDGSRKIELNPVKYWDEQIKNHSFIELKRNFIFNKIIEKQNQIDLETFENIDGINMNLNMLDEIISNHMGDFK